MIEGAAEFIMNDTQLLNQFQNVYHSHDSLRQAVVTLHKQNLELLAMIRQLELERRPEGMDLSILIEARRAHEKHRRT